MNFKQILQKIYIKEFHFHFVVENEGKFTWAIVVNNTNYVGYRDHFNLEKNILR